MRLRRGHVSLTESYNLSDASAQVITVNKHIQSSSVLIQIESWEYKHLNSSIHLQKNNKHKWYIYVRIVGSEHN